MQHADTRQILPRRRVTQRPNPTRPAEHITLIVVVVLSSPTIAARGLKAEVVVACVEAVMGTAMATRTAITDAKTLSQMAKHLIRQLLMLPRAHRPCIMMLRHISVCHSTAAEAIAARILERSRYQLTPAIHVDRTVLQALTWRPSRPLSQTHHTITYPCKR